MAATDAGVDWSKMLPSDLWYFKKLDVAADRIRFRAVSKAWRSLLPYYQPPWLMLAESHSQHQLILTNPLIPPPPRGFVTVGEQYIYQFHLPQSGHQARCVGSTGNWLILIDLEKMFRLLNPFSGVQIDLPSQSTFQYGLLEGENDVDDIPPEDHRDCLVHKVILSPSLSGNGNGRDCIAMAIHHYLLSIC
ncbi:hypothetical protein AQUCO_03500278v1 [Aquilegia coerulea]|uniref:KIB1-4 beta-propeller domain-containing protein n=1 Tax=Aquilegia coerulea TaxID=218851 RepID=A0A2G5CX06_AQUCA|nr:hypothetical protein AQUCO_03500278v1 [Aquilegia coerulea]